MTEDVPHAEEEIAQLRRRLAEAQRRLERAQRIDSLGRVTAEIVHDLSNLLTPLLAASTLLQRQVGPGTPAAALAGEIRATAERSAALLRQILMFLRGEPPRLDVLSLNEVLLDMRPLLERLVGSEVTLALMLGHPIGETRADRRQLEQVIVNLVANARDAMPAGGLVTIRTANVDLENQEESEPGSYVAVMITDTGLGMTPDTQASALEGLFTTKGHEGTGLGLAAVQSFTASVGGRFTVWSKAGVGTTVIVHLPRVPGSSNGSPDPGAAVRAGASR
jgi:two-component system, cell cycle sensor histidine kinase and response regulator CckA